jgi:RND family efflux transporter MFP subunit
MTLAPVSNRFRLVGLALLLGATATVGCGVPASHADAQKAAQAQSKETTVSVATTTVSSRPLPRSLTLTGTLTASRESAVAADVTGKVAETFVERGSRVRAGQPLVRLDRRQADLMEVDARSQAAVARAQATLASSECARAEKLFNDGAINQAELDRAKTQCEATSRSAAAATAREQLANKTVGDLVVKAPFDGVVADRFVNQGEYVRPDSKVANVVQLGRLRLEIGVPEAALAAFGPGAEVQFKVAAYPDQTFTGKVRFVGATVRRATRDLLVDAEVDNKDERLRPGMFAVADVKLGESVLPVVPKSALRSDERAGVDRLFVVDNGVIVERLVHKGPATGDLVAIQTGLKDGEKVVTAPSAELRDGLRVQ